MSRARVPVVSVARLLLGALALAAAGAQAQGRLDAPPPLPAGASSTANAAPSATAAAPATTAASSTDEAAADLPPARRVSPETRIEQRRSGNRVVEIIVTPAGSTRSYSMRNLEGERPTSISQMGAGLSTPTFFKFDF